MALKHPSYTPLPAANARPWQVEWRGDAWGVEAPALKKGARERAWKRP